MCQVCASVRPWAARCDYEGTNPGADASAGRSDKPFLGVGAIVDLLLLDYWGASEPRGWDRRVGDMITYDVDVLSSPARRLAHAAFDEWETVSGLRFVERAYGADIRFTDWDEGAFAESERDWDGTITASRINVDAEWTRLYSNDYDSYNFQTFLHEIGHALGLGHPGPYNGEGVEYEADAAFRNDSWQMSVMSYFDQEEAGTRADHATAVTPMIADVAAVHSLYGVPTVHGGDSVYGERSNVGGMIDRALDFDTPVAVTIVDTGGRDRIDLRSQRADQRIELRDGFQSDVAGLKGNVMIALGTVIEDARTGRGDDRVRGNEAANRIDLGRGDDRGWGREGDDLILGAAGDDRLWGEAGHDRLHGGDDDDRLWGHGGADRIIGGDGRDRMWGGNGDDEVHGGAGRDRAAGGGGDDVLRGGRGRDRLDGNVGDDRIEGGSGDDLLGGGGGNDALFGGSGDDRLGGGGGDDTSFGGGGEDLVWGDDGDDVLWGGSGDDRLLGGDGDDKLSGQSGDDRLEGGHGADHLYGHAGDDHLTGEGGRNVLVGGAGRDTFVFYATSHHLSGIEQGRDLVVDFTPGEDRIDLKHAHAVFNWRDLSNNHMTQEGDDVVVEQDHDTIVLRDTAIADLSPGDFLFA